MRILVPILILLALPSLVSATDYYASPDGSGSQCTQSNPCRISSFWSIADPGDTLFLMDGVYRGSDSMIDPPNNLHGTQGLPITVKALNDGKVEIDGENQRMPILLSYNDWYIIEGINAHSSDSAVVASSRSNNNIIRRVIAWDAKPDENKHIFGSHYGSDNLFEDCAGWGSGRKVFSVFTDTRTTWRRNFFRWTNHETSTWKVGITTTYWSQGISIMENCIGTWDELPSTNLDQTYAIFGHDHGLECESIELKEFGNIGYNLQAQTSHVDNIFSTINLICPNTLKDNVAYTDRLGITTFILDDTGPTSAYRLTSIGGAIRGDAPVVDNSLENPSISALGGDILQYRKTSPPDGAQIKYRYQNGVLTSTPLWPWPMNQRIKEAMVSSGYDQEGGLDGNGGIDLTKLIFELHGGSVPQDLHCQPGEITSSCYCGDGFYEQGYCCNGVLQSNPCSLQDCTGTCCDPDQVCTGTAHSAADCGSCCKGICEDKTCQNQEFQCCEACESGPHPTYDNDCGTDVCCDLCVQETSFSSDPYFGNPDNWQPLNPSRWEVVSDQGDLRYGITTTDYSEFSGSRLGEYSLVRNRQYTNFTLNATVRSTEDFAANPNADYNLVFGYQDGNNYYYVMFNTEPANNEFVRVVNGQRETIDTAPGFAIPDNNYHRVGIEKFGENIRFLFDGNYLDVTDGTFPSGSVGIGGFNDASLWDDIIVREIHRADADRDGCVLMDELVSFIDLWKSPLTDVLMPEIMESIGLWKSGIGCPDS
jgi:hypothetical protein